MNFTLISHDYYQRKENVVSYWNDAVGLVYFEGTELFS